MWTAAGVLVLGGLAALLEIPSLRKRKLRRELAAFCMFLGAGVGLAIAKSLQVNLPNPLEGAAFVFKPASDWLMRLLK